MSAPSLRQAERAALGCALQDPALAPQLKPAWFDDLRHRHLAETLQRLFSEGKHIDTATVAQELSASGIVDPLALVMGCEAGCPSPSGFTYWRDALNEGLILRSVVKVAQSAIQRVTEADGKPVEILDGFERDVMAIREGATSATFEEIDLRAACVELSHEYEAAWTQGKAAGLETGFRDLDGMINGLKPGQLFVIAARPACGKTSLAMNIAEHLAVDNGVPVGVFSLEMSGPELLHRLGCARARVDGAALMRGKPPERDVHALTVAHAAISRSPLHICDRATLTLGQLAAHARRMVRQHGIKLLIVDYLGLLRSGERGRSRYEEITLVSNSLKALAKDLRIPLIALSQLNRDADREGRPPRMADLRDSGSIEQDADLVAMLHREESDGEGRAVSLILSKNRTGRTGKVNLVFLPQFTRFESMTTRRDDSAT